MEQDKNELLPQDFNTGDIIHTFAHEPFKYPTLMCFEIANKNKKALDYSGA